MKPFLTWGILGILLALPAFGERKALVIGNNHYPGHGLVNADNDAEAIAKSLTALGYNTQLVLDGNRQQMEASLSAFSTRLQRGDTALLYYAGHGLQMDGENYLIPVDFRLTGVSDVKAEGISLSSALEAMMLHGASTQIIILDACRDNPFVTGRSLKGGWAGVSTSSAGSYLAFGTSPGSTASDDPSEGHGLFTKALLKYLPDSNLDIEQTFEHVRADVIQQSNAQQVPWTASSLIGTLHLDPRLDAVAQPLGTTTEASLSSAGSLRQVSMRSVPAQAQTATTENADANTQAQMAQANDLARSFHFSAALDVLSAVLSATPYFGPALRLAALIEHQMGHREEALETINRAIELEPSDGTSLMNRCLMDAPNDLKSAVADCNAASQLLPNATAPHLGLAIAFHQAGDIASACQEVAKAAGLGTNAEMTSLVADTLESCTPK